MTRAFLIAAAVLAADPYFGNGCNRGCGSAPASDDGVACGPAVAHYFEIFDSPPRLTPKARELGVDRVFDDCLGNWPGGLRNCVAEAHSRDTLDQCWAFDERMRIRKLADNSD
jgi:hypothetical protein